MSLEKDWHEEKKQKIAGDFYFSVPLHVSVPISIANNFFQWFLNANASFFSSGFVFKAYQILFFDARIQSHCPGSIELSPKGQEMCSVSPVF